MDKVFCFFAGALTIIACSGFAESTQDPKIDYCKASCPSISPDLKCDVGISVSADFLYWKTSQTGTWYGQVANFHTSIPNPAGGTNNFLVITRIPNINLTQECAFLLDLDRIMITGKSTWTGLT